MKTRFIICLFLLFSLSFSTTATSNQSLENQTVEALNDLKAKNQRLQEKIQTLEKSLHKPSKPESSQKTARQVCKGSCDTTCKKACQSKKLHACSNHAPCHNNAPCQSNAPCQNNMPCKQSDHCQPCTKQNAGLFHPTPLYVHLPEVNPESFGFYPTAISAGGQVLAYIAATPVVTSPYSGDRPAFDGSDYIVNISSINRDIRLMQQRRRLFRTYHNMGYPGPHSPILSLSGKIEPEVNISHWYAETTGGDLNLGSSELDVAALINENVEGFISIGYDKAPPPNGGPRITNSALFLNMGFVNIGNLDKTPLYFTGGQLYVPFGRYSSSLITPTLPLLLTRTKSRPFILGYKSQAESGLYAAVYGFRSDTIVGKSGVFGINLGYSFKINDFLGDLGLGYIGSIADSFGMQLTNSIPGTTFGGFASPTNGTELVRKTPGLNLHGNISFDRYSLTGEWVVATTPYRVEDLSYNGHGAKPQAGQLEAGVTFRAFDKPASFALSYQWSRETLALNLPKNSVGAVFSISIWKDTVESIEYRYDKDFSSTQFANGASAPGQQPNLDTFGTGRSAETLSAQIGVYF